MIDRNKDGQVGENYFEYDNTSNSNKNTVEIKETQDDLNGKYGIIDNSSITEDIKKEETTDHNPEIAVTENDLDVASETEKVKDDLKISIEEARTQVDAAEFILEELPFTVAKVRDKLIFLLDQTKEFIKEAEDLLETL